MTTKSKLTAEEQKKADQEAENIQREEQHKARKEVLKGVHGGGSYTVTDGKAEKQAAKDSGEK